MSHLDLSDKPLKNPKPLGLTEHYFPPWCVWDHRRKCPEETTFCDFVKHNHCIKSHIQNMEESK